MSGSIRFTEKDHGWMEMKRKLGRQLDGLSVSVGVQDTEAAELSPRTYMPLGEVAIVNELGLPVGDAPIPPRPFLGTAFEAFNGWRKLVAAAGRNVVDGREPLAEMKAVAKQILADCHKVYDTANMRFPRNAQRTIDRKGHADVLVDDHGNKALRNAITAKVKRGKATVG
jgi:hypothetical protein